MMPTTCSDPPLMRIIRPTMDSSLPNIRSQISWDRMTTGGALGTESSALNQRPRNGSTPSVGISSGVTRALTGRAGGVTSRLMAPTEYAPTDLKDWLLSRNSTNSGVEIQNWLNPRAGNWLVMYSSCSGCGYPSGRSNTPLMTENTAVLAPIPSTSVSIVMNVNAG